MSHRPIRPLTSIAAAILLCGSPALAGTIGLSWDPSVGASGYRVYYGPSEGNYLEDTLYEGPATSVTIDDPALTDCLSTPWHFAVKAYNSIGESGFSEDVSSWPRPSIESVVTPFAPSEAMQGTPSFNLTIQGKNLDGFQFNHPGVVLSSTSIDCNSFNALVTVEPAQGNVPALIGDVSITLENPNGLTASADVFEILVDPSRFDVNQETAKTTDRLDGMDYIWIKKFGGLVYDPDFDFDGDGEVNGIDLMYVANGYGRCWDAGAWDWTVAACPPVSFEPEESQ